LLPRTQAATAPEATVCARCGNRPASRGSAAYCEKCADELGTLWHEDELRQQMLELVYAELSKDPAVRADLDALFERIRPLVKVSAGKKYAFNPASPPPVARKLIEVFVAQWHLPSPRGVIDVWGSVVRAASADPRGKDIPSGSMLRPVRRGHGIGADRRAGEPVLYVVITPNAPAPFPFDPRTMARRQVERRAARTAKELERDILRQADQIIAAWRATVPGWRPMPPRYRKSGEIERIARRVSRAMLGWSIARIASAEDPAASADAARKTLREWLPKLQIEVPARRTPARVLPRPSKPPESFPPTPP